MATENLKSRTIPRRSLPLNALRAFEAAARWGSLARAAEELSVTPGAVSQQIRQLEELVGVTLFHRNGRGVDLTDEARAVLPVLSDAFDRLRRAGEALSGAADTGRVRVAAPGALAIAWLAPRLSGFAASHDGFSAALTTDAGPSDLERFQVDLEIRFGAGDYPGLERRRLMGETISPAVSPALLASLDDPRVEAAVATLPLLHDVAPNQDPSTPDWAGWLAARGLARPDAGRGHRFSSSDHVVDAAVAGLGVGLVKRTLADAAVARGDLEVLFLDKLTVLEWGWDVVWPRGRRLSAAAAAFLAWLEAQAAPFEHAGV